jgi:hypothetical protein
MFLFGLELNRNTGQDEQDKTNTQTNHKKGKAARRIRLSICECRAWKVVDGSCSEREKVPLAGSQAHCYVCVLIDSHSKPLILFSAA